MQIKNYFYLGSTKNILDYGDGVQMDAIWFTLVLWRSHLGEILQVLADHREIMDESNKNYCNIFELEMMR